MDYVDVDVDNELYDMAVHGVMFSCHHDEGSEVQSANQSTR